MTPKERVAIQQALEYIQDNAYDEAITILEEALDHSGEANEMVLTGLRITNLDDKLEFEPVYSEPVKRPQNCGTGYCSCIECPYEAEQAEQDLDICPGCGGIADNGHDREFPPNPYYCTKCTEQAEQEPVAFCGYCKNSPCACPVLPMPTANAAPVRTKDLTDDEILAVFKQGTTVMDKVRAVIAKDREKNK